jgi:hypothetical protein
VRLVGLASPEQFAKRLAIILPTGSSWRTLRMMAVDRLMQMRAERAVRTPELKTKI